MAQTVTLANLITHCRDRFEIDDGVITDSTLTDWINGSYFGLYNILVDANPHWFATYADQNIVAGTGEYALPTDFWRALRIDVIDTNNMLVTLKRYEFGEENAYLTFTVQERGVTRYIIQGGNVRLNPKPTWSEPNGLRVWYAPAPAALTTGVTPVSMDAVSGWDEWVVLDVGIKWFVRMEFDPGAIMAQKKLIESQIRDMAADRDSGNPPRVRNAYRERFLNIYGRFYNP